MSERIFYEISEKAFALEQSGKRIIRLNVGDTNLPTPECAVEAAVQYMKKSKSAYGSAAGMQELREKIAEREQCGVENVVVGPGSKHILYALMSTLCKMGDGVIFPSPHWPAYELACRQLGLQTQIIKTRLEDLWEFELNGVNFDNTKLMIICNPLNPTSTIYSEALMKKTIEEATRMGVAVILDEAYKGLAFKSIPKYEKTIIVKSFSKEFNMEGWRLGYAVAPKEIVKRLISFNQITMTCTPAFVQRAGLACLENEEEILKNNRTTWHNRARRAQITLKRLGFEFAEPQAGIYVFAKHRKISKSEEYALKLLEKGVAISPGSGFGDFGEYIRICYNQPDAVMDEALNKIEEMLE